MAERLDARLVTPSAGRNGRALAVGLTHSQAVDRARALTASLRQRVEQTERLRQIPDESIAELVDCGLFSLATPRAWGGAELPPHTWFKVTAELAGACASTGWVYGVLLGHMWLVSQFPAAAQAEVFGNPRSLVASLVRMGGASPEPVPGGFRWRAARGRFCSGIDHADWIVAGGTTPPMPHKPAEQRWFLIPRADITLVDDWFSVGLQGTGSKSIQVADAFIPEHRAILQSDLNSGRAPGRTVNDGPLYRLPGSTWAFTLPATCLGIAREAVRVMTGQLRSRHAALSADARAEQSAALATFAEAASDIDVSYAVLLNRAQRLMDCADTPYSDFDAVVHRRDIVYAVQRTRRAVNQLMELSGGSGIYATAEMQRLWRDCNASAAHGSFAWGTAMTAYGRALVGAQSSGPP